VGDLRSKAPLVAYLAVATARRGFFPAFDARFRLASAGSNPVIRSNICSRVWKAAVVAARADGIDLRVTDSYRTYDQQVDLAQRKGLYADGGLAAVPGTSNHGWGLAVDADITNPATMSWLRSNGYKYGFVEAVSREPWHWEFRPSQA
jgi:LAS superfamily LD-carboxypeptidase LdcB